MSTHRPRSEAKPRGRRTADSAARGADAHPSGAAGAPLDAGWLEQIALRHVARWETTRQGLGAALERRLQTRCARTGEDAEPLLALIPEIVEAMAARGAVDDRRYAEQRIRRLRRQGRSRAEIVAALAAKGVEVDASNALEALEGSDADPRGESRAFAAELDAAWRTARKRHLGPFRRGDRSASDASNRARELAILARRGFSEEIATLVVDAENPPESLRAAAPHPALPTRGRHPA